MIGRLYIDNRDMYAEFGIYVEFGGWNELLSMPPLKSVEYNDWHEFDGLEMDLSEPKLDSRDISIKFIILDVDGKYQQFVNFISQAGYREFRIASINRNYTLRYVSVSSFSNKENLGFISVKFANDFPLKDYQYQAPISTITARDTFKIDGKKLSDYNTYILAGMLDEIRKQAEVKSNLTIKIQSQHGATYDVGAVTFKYKDVKIHCLITADTLDVLWRNYDALLYDLTRPNERTLTVKALNQEYKFCYKSCQVTEFYPTDNWLKFTLTLTFI